MPKDRLKGCITDPWYHTFLEMGKDNIIRMVKVSDYLNCE
jgi:hypothetical protein